jgi:hypothetical protein
MAEPLYMPDFDFVGRCYTCGFIAKHAETFLIKLPPPRFFEIESDEREVGFEAGVFVHHPEAARNPAYHTAMVCFVGAARFRVRISGPSEQARGIADARAALRENRRCSAWFPHQPGQSPQEHLELKQMLDLERRREEVNRNLAKMAKSGADAQRAQVYVTLGIGIVTVLVVLFASWRFQPKVTNQNFNSPPTNNIEITLPSPAPTPTPLSTAETPIPPTS